MKATIFFMKSAFTVLVNGVPESKETIALLSPPVKMERIRLKNSSCWKTVFLRAKIRNVTKF